MLESSEYTTAAELADGEDIGRSCVCRVLRLTVLAPDIVGAILDGRQPKGLRLAAMLGNGLLDWGEQRGTWNSRSWVEAASSASQRQFTHLK
jgi:hypothetical protein